METIKNVLAVIALLTSIFQMVFSNDQRAKENLDATAKIIELSREVKEQNLAIEAAFHTKIE